MGMKKSGSHLHMQTANQSANQQIMVRSLEIINKNNDLNDNEVYLELFETANLMGLTKRSLQKAIKKGKFITKIATGRGGKRYLIALSSLPPEARLKYYSNHNISPPSDPVSVSKESPHTDGNGAFFNVPEKFKSIALARLDLVRMWRQFREASPKKTEADHAFIDAYNCKKIAHHIYEILGEVSVKSLYRWIDALDGSEDYTRLIPRWNCGNRGHGLTHDEEKAFLKFLLSPKQISIGSAIRLTKFYLSQRGIDSPSHPMTFRRFAERWRAKNLDKWVLAREGQKALRDKLEPFIVRDPSLLSVGDVLVADGHRLAFQVVNPFTGKPCRATLVGFLDWKSFALVGYEVMLTENVQCIASALRNAIISIGKVPKIVYIDNGKAFRAKYFTGVDDFNESGIYGLFARLGIVPQFAMPYNARAKVIERWFREFQETFEKLLPSYVGSSVTNKPAYMLRNEKFHKAMHNEYIPTIEETIKLIDAWLEFDYSQPCPNVKGKTKGEVLMEGRGSGVDVASLDELMMEEKVSKIYRNGIRFLGADYWDEALYGMSEQVIIRYSLFDLSYIKVYDLIGNFICSAQRTMPIHPVARVLGDSNDIETLKRHIKVQRRLEKRTISGLKGLMNKEAILDWQHIPAIEDKKEKEVVKEGTYDLSVFVPNDEKRKKIVCFECDLED